jgi:hypothetical protein
MKFLKYETMPALNTGIWKDVECEVNLAMWDWETYVEFENAEKNEHARSMDLMTTLDQVPVFLRLASLIALECCNKEGYANKAMHVSATHPNGCRLEFDMQLSEFITDTRTSV